jgi:diadenosine tetraphosphate (Ap4A) HIT family hydrolase
MTDCVFCDIVAGERPASIVYQDGSCTAFMDIQPVNPGHTLVVPNEHAASLAELDPEAGEQMFQLAQRIAQALRDSGIRCEGVNLMLADGAAAGQEVPHVHLHILPRYRGDGFGFRSRPDYSQRPSRSDLDDRAAQIRGSLDEREG